MGNISPYITAPTAGTFIVTFTASASNGGYLDVYQPNIKDGYIYPTSTPTLYSVTVSTTASNRLIYILPKGAANGSDITISNISIVQKPLDKLTINGVDGFLSGKWTNNNSIPYTVIDDATISFTPTAAYQVPLFYLLPVMPNTTYTLSGSQVDGNGAYFGIDYIDSNGSLITNYNAGNNALVWTFTTPSNCAKVRINFSSRVSGGWTQCIFKNILLNLGAIPAPYSKKTGDRMMLPTAKKNLVSNNPNVWEQGGLTGTIGNSFTANKQVSTSRIRYIQPVYIKPNTTYTVSLNNAYFTGIQQYNSSDILLLDSGWITSGSSYTFTTRSDTSQLHFAIRNADNVSVVDTSMLPNIQFQLEQGAILTPYTPYAVQTNKLPKRYVPKKNMLPLLNTTDYNQAGDGPNNTVVNGKLNVTTYDTDYYGRGLIVNVTANKPYTLSCFIEANAQGQKAMIDVGYGNLTWELVDDNGMVGSYSKTFTPTQSKIYIKFAVVATTTVASPILISNIQLEQNSTSTLYEAYTPILPPKKTGLSFNGVTDYLQLPSMTMDAIEIECFIDSNNANNTLLVDARTGLTNGAFYNDITFRGADWTSIKQDGVERVSQSLLKGFRTKILAKANNSFTDNLTILAHNSGTAGFTKGTLYKVTCYLAGSIVAQYDFEKGNVIGTSILQNAQNLIPNFEDSRWSIPVDWKVLGKDFINSNNSISQCICDVVALPNVNYKIVGFTNSSRFEFYSVNISGTESYLGTLRNGANFANITTLSDTAKIRIKLYYAVTNGAYDFIKPQLYQLDGKEGTINGSPVQLNKPNKRTLYAKR